MAIVLLLISTWLAPVAEAPQLHEGQVVSVGVSKITLLDKNGENEQFDVAPDAKITLNGKPADLADVKTGDSAKLIVKTESGKPVVVVIEARTKE